MRLAKGKYQEWLTEDGLLLLRRWARNGMTDDEIAEAIGINRVTLYKWKAKYSNIGNALKRTKEVYDSEVEEALENAALGYYKKEREWRRDPDTGDMVLYREYEKWFKPDVTAQIFWLKNRDKLHWRDKQEIQMDLEEDEYGVLAMPDVLPAEQPPEEEDGEK